MRAFDQLQERLADALFHVVAGPDGKAAQLRIHGTPGPRWFAPDSAIAHVHGDTSMYVGGLRALMMQSLHPTAMWAVAEHSGYRGDMFGRLARTSTFLATTTFGAASDAEESVALVNRIHQGVRGTLPDGTPYVAADPHLLAWIHAAEVDSFLTAHQHFGAAPLDPAGCDAYLADTATIARRLGVIDPPTTVAALTETLAAYRPELRGTPEAVDAIAYVRTQPPLSRQARPGYAVLWAAAVSLMPAWTRTELGLAPLTRRHTQLATVGGHAATKTLRWVTKPLVARARALEAAALTPTQR
ncbi:MAG: oxygenase MpaB family protein [Nocardioides sp.]